MMLLRIIKFKLYLNPFFILFISLLSFNIYSLNKRTESWNVVSHRFTNIDKKYEIYIKTDNRFSIGKDSRFLSSVNRLSYSELFKSGNIFSLGYDFIPRDAGNSLIIEQRIWQSYSKKLYSKNKFKSLNLISKLEQRWEDKTSGISLRLREKMQFDLSLAPNTDLILFDEIFINLNHPKWVNKSTLEQNRFFIGFNFTKSKYLDFLFGYINQYDKILNGNNLNNIIAIDFNFKS